MVKCWLMDMGLIKGIVIFICKVVFLVDLIEINVCGYELMLWKSEVELILVEKEESEWFSKLY